MSKQSEDKKELRNFGFDPLTTDLLEHLVTLNNYHEHITAKHQLEKKGDEILPVMHALANAESAVIRREAIKIIKHIKDPASIPIAIQLLDDVDGDIRWMAAETLIDIGRASLRPLLKALHENQDAYFLRKGAHHVLAALIRNYDTKELKELQRTLLNAELQATLPLRISKILNSPQNHI